ncbi:MAG: carboxypeptidase-like regulatory domain-containing protein [Candidatus Shapirobacteria bacterium]
MINKNKMVLLIIFGIALIVFGIKFVLGSSFENKPLVKENSGWWQIQSIDTVKYSRDMALEKIGDNSFDEIIESQVNNIALTGATHIAIGTPYDKEFISFLARWVKTARRYDLKVWFRSNFSGWEEWFGYKRISREEHLSLLKAFIIDNGNLFEDGDIFSACVECENGGPGDPRKTGDVAAYREFLVKEYTASTDAFRKIGKNVRANVFPMNGDVAKLVMDKSTTQKLGGIVTIDHYVAAPAILVKDIADIAELSGGRVFLGEFGVPIPDIHGQISEADQAEWVEEALGKLAEVPELLGLNYWVSYGGTTRLWEKNNEPRSALFALVRYFKPKLLTGRIIDELGRPIAMAKVSLGSKSYITQKEGCFTLGYVSDRDPLIIEADGYKRLIVQEFSSKENIEVALEKEKETIYYKIYKKLYKLIHKNLL